MYKKLNLSITTEIKTSKFKSVLLPKLSPEIMYYNDETPILFNEDDINSFSCDNNNNNNRGLLYFTFFGNNKKYMECFNIMFNSLNNVYNGNEKFDILILTDNENKIKIENEINTLYKLKTFILPKIIGKGYCARYQIFEWNEIWNYNKILYVDIDTLFINNPQSLFDLNIDKNTFYLKKKIGKDLSYISYETDIIEDYLKKAIEIENIYKQINSGQFMISVNNRMLEHLSRIHSFIDKIWNLWGKYYEIIADQMCLNYYIIYMNCQVNYDIMENYMSLYEIDKTINKKKIFYHLVLSRFNIDPILHLQILYKKLCIENIIDK